MTGLGIYGMQNGDLRRIVYPLDFDGNVCGTDLGEINMTEYPYLYYVNDYSGGVCVKECPHLTNLTDPFTLVTYDGLYQVEGFDPNVAANISVADYSSSNNTLDCSNTLCYPDYNDPTSSLTSIGVNQGKGFAYYALDTYEVLWRCVFREEATDKLDAIVAPNGSNLTEDLINQATQNEHIKKGYSISQNLTNDLWISRYYILALGFGAPIVIGFIYAFLLRIPCVLAVMVWFSVFATIGIVFAGAWYAGETASQWKAADPPVYNEDEIKAATYASYALYGVGGILVLLFLFMRKRIQLAMGCVKEASKAIMKMPMIIFFPVIQGIGFMLFMIAWTVYSVNIASMGDFASFGVDSSFLP